MDTVKYCVLIVTFVVLVCMQHNPEATPGDPCTEMDSSNCTNTSEVCDRTTCTCSPDFYLDQGQCEQKLDLDSNCTEQKQCKTGNASCHNGRCQCNGDYYQDGHNSCLENFNSTCNGTSQCMANNASFQNGICACNADFYPDRQSLCNQKLSLGNMCSKTEQCKPETATCFNGTCSCSDAFYEFDNYTCLQKLDLDSNCTEPKQCKTGNASCHNGRCQCNGDYYQDGHNTCFEKLDLDSNCTEPKQCKTENASCHNGHCQCNDDYYRDGPDACLERKDYAGSCSGDQCKTPFNCTSTSGVSKCLCADGFYEDGNNCISSDALKPLINTSTIVITHNSVTLQWTSPYAVGYTNSYIIKYNGGSTANLGDVQRYTVDNLSPGRAYTFNVSRSISREGRTQDNIHSSPVTRTTKEEYGRSCTDTLDCKSGLTCVDVTQAEKKCLCEGGKYLSSGNCVSTDALKPLINTSTIVITHNSVTLQWTSPYAVGYTNSYIIKYNGGSTANLGDVQRYTVDNLSPGRAYTFNVSRSITSEGRKQDNIDSSTVTSTTKLDYAAPCDPTKTECRSGLACITDVNKCLCQNGSYLKAGVCTSNSELQSSITNVSFSTNSATVRWNSPPAPDYASTYTVKYLSTETEDLGDVNQTVISDLTPGMTILFIVSRSITREGRTQQNISSQASGGATEKIDYGGSCTANGTCKDMYSDCHSGFCRCSPGYFRDTQRAICQTYGVLKPQNITTTRISTTQIDVTWLAPGYAYAVHGYELEVSPAPGDISITGTTATLSSLTPGQRYNIIVKTIINYQNRNETTAANETSEIAIPARTSGLADKTTLNAPNISIWFHQAQGSANSYNVHLQRGTPHEYDKTNPEGNTGLTIKSDFFGVKPGLEYNITITTNSNGVQSVPYSTTRMVKAEQAGQVEQLTPDSITSRSISVTWMRPTDPNGIIYQYSLEILNGTKCVKRIIFSCTGCSSGRMATNESSTTICSHQVNLTIPKTDIDNPSYTVNNNITDLLPDTTYTITVAAFNEEGRGRDSTRSGLTLPEGASEPTNFRSPSHTSNSIQLEWNPPVPRPGITAYNISVYERLENSDDYNLFSKINKAGYYENSLIVDELSSYWYYKFKIAAYTIFGTSEYVEMPDAIRTAESQPAAVVELRLSDIKDVFDQILVSWKCPEQKDGRNGVITHGIINYTTNTKSDYVNPKEDVRKFPDNNDCSWNETVSVTAEFNYTFQVYVQNSGYSGVPTPVVRYMPAGPGMVAAESITAPQSQVLSETIIHILVCPSCILDGRNGRVTSSGAIVCKHPCQQRKRRKRETENVYDKLANWNTAKGNDFNVEYRATPKNWLSRATTLDKLVYQIGNDTSCEQKEGSGFCNGPLPAGTKFEIQIFACTSAGCNRGDRVTIETKEPPSNLAIIIGAVCGCIAAIIVVVLIVLAVRYVRRKNDNYTEHTQIIPDGEELIEKKRPIAIKNFEKRIEEMHKDSNLLFSEEFEDINTLSPKHLCTASETGGNKLKNRYVNILPFDHSRVKLLPTEEDDEETDYINANYIPGYRSLREYIATQGPMTGTVNDYWRMIWEQNVPIIVMLSDLMEKGKPKVDRYYPENMEPVQYGEIVVEMTNFSPLSKYVIRIFKLQQGNEIRMVRHYFLPGWQDFGANLTSDDVINFLKSVRMEIKPNNQGPICVHCSAGVGRTGTYISLDVFQQHIDEENMDKELDIFDFALRMRQNRSYMIQTEKQYIFVHDTIKEMIIRKKKEMSERDHIYQNSAQDDNVYENQAFEADTQDIYMNVDTTTGKPTTAL